MGPCATFCRGPDGSTLILRAQRLLQNPGAGGGGLQLWLLEQVIAHLSVGREGKEQDRFDSVAFRNKGVMKFET